MTEQDLKLERSRQEIETHVAQGFHRRAQQIYWLTLGSIGIIAASVSLLTLVFKATGVF